MQTEKLFKEVLDCSFKIHSALGPGLLESAYEECLFYELTLRKLNVCRQLELSVNYKKVKLDIGYKLDLLVEKKVVVELKAVERFERIHEAQVLTYLKLGGWTVGLLINFNVPILKTGIKRVVLNYQEPSSALSASLR